MLYGKIKEQEELRLFSKKKHEEKIGFLYWLLKFIEVIVIKIEVELAEWIASISTL